MIVCDICKADVAQHRLGINKMVYGMLPVEVSTVGYSKATWVDTDDGSGMTMFIHDGCWRTLLEHKEEEERNFPPE